MSHPCCGENAGREGGREAARGGAIDWLALAASPTFAAMALLSSVGGDPAAMICSTTPFLPLNGMALMYLLMSAFHATPWLRLLGGRP